jgi:hypothetical protein
MDVTQWPFDVVQESAATMDDLPDDIVNWAVGDIPPLQQQRPPDNMVNPSAQYSRGLRWATARSSFEQPDHNATLPSFQHRQLLSQEMGSPVLVTPQGDLFEGRTIYRTVRKASSRVRFSLKWI